MEFLLLLSHEGVRGGKLLYVIFSRVIGFHKYGSLPFRNLPKWVVRLADMGITIGTNGGECDGVRL